MTIYSLQQKRFEAAKQKVHSQLVDYFVDLEEQRRLWYFTLTVNNNARAHQFTQPQAEELLAGLKQSYDIRRANLESARAFDPCRKPLSEKEDKILKFQKGGVAISAFEEYLGTMFDLIRNKLLEFRQALSLALVLLDNYPGAQRVFK